MNVKSKNNNAWSRFRALLFFLFGLVFIGGCNPKFTDELLVEESKLVLWGYLNPDSVVTINLSQTSSPFGEVQNRFIENGTVILLDNDLAIDTLIYAGNGNYRSLKNTKPELKHLYSVTAMVPGFSTATSIPDSIPIKPTIISDQVNDSVGIGNGSDQVLAQIILDVDSSGVNSDYIGIYIETTDSSLTTPGWQIPDYFECKAEHFSVLFYVFSNISCRQPVTSIPIETGNLSKDELTHYKVTLCRINAGSYEYHQKLSTMATNSDAGAMLNLFYDPIILPVKVLNGYGFVGGINTSTVTVYF